MSKLTISRLNQSIYVLYSHCAYVGYANIYLRLKLRGSGTPGAVVCQNSCQQSKLGLYFVLDHVVKHNEVRDGCM